MKKYIFCILLLCQFLPLYAQSGTSVFVLPVTGNGSKPGDNDFFYKKLVSEVTYQQFSLAKTQNDAEFYLISTISSRPYNEGDPSGAREYVFHLSLMETKTNTVKADGELVYDAPEEIDDQFSSLVYSLLYTIPEGVGKDNWRNKWLYAGAAFFWTPRIYTAENSLTYLDSFGGGISFEYHFLNFLSVESGFELASDLIKIVPKAKTTYSNLVLEIPVLIKGVIKPGDYFVLEPYAGLHFNIPFEKTTVPPPLSWLIGFQYGVKAGPGVLFVDPRFSMDIGKSALAPVPGAKNLSFQRYIIHIGIGYKLGFLTRR